jgi:hypothetical protein
MRVAFPSAPAATRRLQPPSWWRSISDCDWLRSFSSLRRCQGGEAPAKQTNQQRYPHCCAAAGMYCCELCSVANCFLKAIHWYPSLRACYHVTLTSHCQCSLHVCDGWRFGGDYRSVYWPPYVVTPIRWRCRLSIARHSEWVITGTCCDPRPICGEGVVLRNDEGSCLSDRLAVYTTVVTMCSIAAQWQCDWCTRGDHVCHIAHLWQVSQLKMCDFSGDI